jgi:hypothetical protein
MYIWPGTSKEAEVETWTINVILSPHLIDILGPASQVLLRRSGHTNAEGMSASAFDPVGAEAECIASTMNFCRRSPDLGITSC